MQEVNQVTMMVHLIPLLKKSRSALGATQLGLDFGKDSASRGTKCAMEREKESKVDYVLEHCKYITWSLKVFGVG